MKSSIHRNVNNVLDILLVQRHALNADEVCLDQQHVLAQDVHLAHRNTSMSKL